MNRRQFLTWVGIGGMASYLPVAMIACASESSNTNTLSTTPALADNSEETTKIDPTPRADGFFEVGTISQLNDKGEISELENEVIVIRDPETLELIALTSLCPHQGCTVKWDGNNNNLACPCHQSTFTKEGEVISGPAVIPLDKYEVKEEKGIVLVRII